MPSKKIFLVSLLRSLKLQKEKHRSFCLFIDSILIQVKKKKKKTKNSINEAAVINEIDIVILLPDTLDCSDSSGCCDCPGRALCQFHCNHFEDKKENSAGEKQLTGFPRRTGAIIRADV